MDSTVHEYIKTNHIQLHVAKAGPEEGKLIIFLHGFPEFWFGWRKQIDYFTEQGYRVWVPDQRGYNRSEKPLKVRDYRTEVLAADIAGLIEASGKEQVILVGHDWGGIVAWRVARTYPDLVERLIILNAPHEVAMASYGLTHPTQLLRSTYAGFFQIRTVPEKLVQMNDWLPAMQMLERTSREGTFTDEDLCRYREAWSQPRAFTSMLNWYRAMGRSFSGGKIPEKVPVPVMVIWGAKDQFLERGLARKSVDYCSQGRLVFFENATHWVHLEESTRVNILLERFIEDETFLAGKLVSME